jgi:transposase-like protein
MSTMRTYTQEFRESAVCLVLSGEVTLRKAAEDLGMPYDTMHGWVRAAQRAGRKAVPKELPRTLADAEARVRALEAPEREGSEAHAGEGRTEKRRRTSRGSSREVRLHPRKSPWRVLVADRLPVARREPERVLPPTEVDFLAPCAPASRRRGGDRPGPNMLGRNRGGSTAPRRSLACSPVWA